MTSHNFPEKHTAENTVTKPWLIVMLREIAVKVRDKAFVFSTISTVVLIVGVMALNAFLMDRSQEFTVATDSDAGDHVVQLADAALTGDDTMAAERASRDDARSLVSSGDADAAIYQQGGEWVIVVDTELDSTLGNTLTAAISEHTLTVNSQKNGVDLDDLRAGSDHRVEYMTGGNDRGFATYILRMVFAFLFYFSAIVFGMAIANSVLEEKQNRVVEILATAIPIRQLLYGKVLGNCGLVFAQIGLYACVGLLAANVLGLAADIGWALTASGWFVVFFVFGFTAQATIWAALGSLASRTEDLQSNTMVISTVLMVGMFSGIIAQGPWLAVASYIPIVSSIAMPVRLLEGQAQVWEPFVSLTLCVLFGWFMLRVGEKVYQRAVFQGGRSLKWREALKIEQ